MRADSLEAGANLAVAMTGASGFLGARVRKLLLERGRPVVRIGRREAELSVDLLAGVPKWPTSVPATLLHCAGIMTADAGTVLGSVQMAVNLLGSLPDGVRRLVLVSSAYVYAPAAAPVGEDETPRPADPYAHAKLAVEEVFRGYALSKKRELVVLRPCAIYGPDDPHTKAVTRFVSDGRRGVRPTLAGPVSFQRDYIHVDDAALGVVRAIESASGGTTYNLCTGKQYSAVELAGLLGEIEPSLAVTTDAPAADALGYRFDPSRAARDLDFRAAIDLRDAMRTMLKTPC